MKENKLKQPDFKDITSIIKKLRLETEKEHIYIIKAGKAIAWFEGDSDSVHPPIEQLIRFKDALILHNHPFGTSMSLEDVKTTISSNAKELRIITSQNIFRLRRPNSGWDLVVDSKVFIDNFNKSFYKVRIY